MYSREIITLETSPGVPPDRPSNPFLTHPRVLWPLPLQALRRPPSPVAAVYKDTRFLTSASRLLPFPTLQKGGCGGLAPVTANPGALPWLTTAV